MADYFQLPRYSHLTRIAFTVFLACGRHVLLREHLIRLIRRGYAREAQQEREQRFKKLILRADILHLLRRHGDSLIIEVDKRTEYASPFAHPGPRQGPHSADLLQQLRLASLAYTVKHAQNYNQGSTSAAAIAKLHSLFVI